MEMGRSPHPPSTPGEVLDTAPMGAEMKHEKLPNGGIRLTTSRGGAAAWFAGPLLHMTCWGDGEGALARAFLSELTALIRDKKSLVCFNDLEQLRTYDPTFRARFDDWGAQTKEEIATVHVLVRSKLVAMAIAVFALFQSGRVRSYSSRKEWEAALLAHGGTLETSRLHA